MTRCGCEQRLSSGRKFLPSGHARNVARKRSPGGNVKRVPEAQSPKVVVVPFGVPSEGHGLGLGLAARLHSFAQLNGENVALAQLFSHPSEGKGDPERSVGAPTPVEAFVPPTAWKDLVGHGNVPAEIHSVVTGAFEPPIEGRGLLQILVFDGRDGRARARVEAHVDPSRAGETVLDAFSEVWSSLNGDLGAVRDIRDLNWDALESVLRAERCALHDPHRGGPHDRLAAMLHLGRAIGDAPASRFPAGRLAAIALDSALALPADPKLSLAALRALSRAAEDAPDQVDLIEATAALTLRLGDPTLAESHVRRAIHCDPERARLYALLGEIARARGDLPGALRSVEEGLSRHPDDALLGTEKGVVLAEQGDMEAARAAWKHVLRQSLHPPAFANLASVALRTNDHESASGLVDLALKTPNAHPEVFRRAIHLALQSEPDGLARAARVDKLAQGMLDVVPSDPWATFARAKALAQLGQADESKTMLHRVESMAPGSPLAAEAQRGRVALEDPKVSLEIDAVLRAAHHAELADLEAIVARANRIALEHPAWMAHFAAGIAYKRLGQFLRARTAFEAALVSAPGCTPAHAELAHVFIQLTDHGAARKHAERACELEGETPRNLGTLASVLHSSGKRDEALLAIEKALLLDATDEANRALAERIRAGSSLRVGPLSRIRESFARWTKR